jgi:hypothetical protein
MKKVCAKVALKNSTNGQLHWRIEVDSDVFQHIKRMTGLNRVVIEDEIWGFQHNPESARQGIQWKSPGSPIPECMDIKKSGQCWFISLTAKV